MPPWSLRLRQACNLSNRMFLKLVLSSKEMLLIFCNMTKLIVIILIPENLESHNATESAKEVHEVRVTVDPKKSQNPKLQLNKPHIGH